MLLESRIVRLESRRSLTAEQEFSGMSDEQLEAFLIAALKRLTPKELEEDLREHPECRELYGELLGRETAS
ncbi:MAG: hypothetical protein WBQ37_05865 [Candidatus Competibacter sp.]